MEIPRQYLTVFLLTTVSVLVWRQEAAASLVPREVKQTVTFIYREGGDGQPVPAGTGFFVALDDSSQPERTYGYLVTAKHLLVDKRGGILDRIWIRLNRRDGKAALLTVLLRGANAVPVFTHDDPTVDLAAIPMLPDPAEYELLLLPRGMLATKERFTSVGISEGDEVFFTGLFTPFVGSERNYPIARFGRVALITHERIPWKGQPTNLYLIESQSFGGNSGSPVFFRLAVDRTPGILAFRQSDLLLAGVIKGSFLEPSEVQYVERGRIPVSVENLGISAVPAYLLDELLDSEQIRAHRKAIRK